MRLNTAFIQLNCRFDYQALQKEVLALPEAAWHGHPQGFKGNSAVPLIARNGDENDDATHGQMQATKWLAQLPQVKQVMARLGAPLGRSRLMRIQGTAQVPLHTDLDYYWQRRMRVHVPIITNESVRFECGDKAVHMAAGETWVFDTTQLHRVLNPQGGDRIHLVIDTVGSDQMFNLMSNAPAITPHSDQALRFESHNLPDVMSPHEQREIFNELMSLLATEHTSTLLQQIKDQWQPILSDWQATWAEHGTNPKAYTQLHLRMEQAAAHCAPDELFRGSPIAHWLSHWLVLPAMNQANSDPDGDQSNTPDETSEMDRSYASQYTDSFPALIAHLGGSLVVSTYASNRLVILRSNGAELNTHFKEYPGPMGMALNGSQLALGARNSVWLFRSQPDLGATIEPNSDAVFVPHKRLMTGDIRIHEMGWSDDQLWFVNTRFSCLATLDETHSFIPQWHPPFIQDLSAEDACHLNGLAMREGKAAYVTALGISAEPGGWREHKRTGGVVMSVPAGEVISEGLCMPHSPKWHQDNLWVLDSGHGKLCQIDLKTGQRTTVARLPGFTRGLVMIDRYAFIGCSRVREKAWFGGLPILEQDEPPACGVWAVDLVSGEIIAWLQFEEGIDEIFDLLWLPQMRWPEVLEPEEITASNGFLLPEDHLPQFQ